MAWNQYFQRSFFGFPKCGVADLLQFLDPGLGPLWTGPKSLYVAGSQMFAGCSQGAHRCSLRSSNPSSVLRPAMDWAKILKATPLASAQVS